MWDIYSPLKRYIDHLLQLAKYEYSKDIQSWCAYIEEFPGIYAQKNTVEETRKELEEMLKEFIFINLAKGLPLPHFGEFSNIKEYVTINSNQPQRACA